MVLLFIDVALAWLLDRLLGDPPRWPHPVNGIGALIGYWEKAWYPNAGSTAGKKFFRGLCLTVATVAVSALLAAGWVLLAGLAHPVALHAVTVYLFYAALAGRCLEVEARKVHRALNGSETSLEEARQALSMLVSRDTNSLDTAAVVRATVETVAENTVDGVLSPLFWIFIGLACGLALGLPAEGTAAAAVALVWTFKAASTLDSRVGYKTERYLYFGRASARLDDALNFLPARLSLIVIPLAALLTGLRPLAAFRLGFRDRLKHQSPNSAHPEATFAGALGIELGGAAVYQGKLEQKPTLGDGLKPAAPGDITRATTLMHTSSLLFLLLGLACLAPLVF